jgi:hypothetical protein
MADLKNVALMGASTLVRLAFGVLTFAIMARLLVSLELDRLISALYANARLVQVVTKKLDACRRPSGRQCFAASLHPMTEEIA